MLHDIYLSVKTQLLAQVAGLEGVEKYNVQYEGSIATTPRIFVAFPEQLQFDQVSKQSRRTPLKMRLHVVTQALAETDGTVSDSISAEHETIALAVMNAIDKFTPVDGVEKLTSPMQFSGWQDFDKYRGWKITFVEFDCRKLL